MHAFGGVGRGRWIPSVRHAHCRHSSLDFDSLSWFRKSTADAVLHIVGSPPVGSGDVVQVTSGQW
eukprot:scaffold6931_cov443-Prasinococcus_capsulatus_cf.AAC.5